ncbi:hypothetical protein [Halorubrum sp. Atlit-26R]|uniref:hypothetical protein n=1 Tax=Halorubrum sp. Atlit-26R TaxID=2282128 RepID=UPI000EF19DBE|nr:hypothetical protein [Halorubrum sp. Atlit-26R]RLM68377.1 hypothetical protein DVK07_11415 [Halorubrum sp. Atlit-26R]
MSLRSRLLGSALLVVGVAALGLAGTVAPGFVPSPSSAEGIAFVTPSPVSFLAAPALLAAGSVLLVGGAAAAGGTERSARAALVAPALGAAAAFAFGVGLVLAPASVPETATNPAAHAALIGRGSGIAAGAVVGAALAPVVQAAITEDTVALLAGAVLLLAAIASGSSLPLSLVAGGVGGAVAVGLLWAVDPERWRP